MTGSGVGNSGLQRAGADLSVQCVHSGRPDPDTHLPWTRLWDLDVRLVQNFGSAELIKLDSFHELFSSC